jgi:K+ potassium transporter integral membrane domain
MGQGAGRLALGVGALGVVFGDIGTSPLYTEQTVFTPADPHPVRVSQESVFGIVSLIVCSVVIVVTVTYVQLVMRADQLPGAGRPHPRRPGRCRQPVLPAAARLGAAAHGVHRPAC